VPGAHAHLPSLQKNQRRCRGLYLPKLRQPIHVRRAGHRSDEDDDPDDDPDDDGGAGGALERVTGIEPA
jgi:hypothetical protein